MLVLAASCTASNPEVEIRAVGTAALQSSDRFREAQAQLALGNVGLSLELFRKAARENPESPEALVGAARCYDMMGRFDLSRTHYEQALALAPTNTGILNALAASLDLQGKSVEAAVIRQEVAARLALASSQPTRTESREAATREVKAGSLQAGAPLDRSLPISPEPSVPAIGSSVTVALNPTEPNPVVMRPVRSAVGASVTVALSSPDVATAKKAESQTFPARVRLERLSTREVVLVTSRQPVWIALAAPARQLNAAAKVTTTSPSSLRILNAARKEGFARQARSYLEARGWRKIQVGDAPMAQPRTVLLYPAHRRLIATRLANQFHFPVALRTHGGPMTLLLGTEAASSGSRRHLR